ncbi:MAG TPA: hypothetical protein VFM48_08000, partial [Aquabacterium sp.]|nr:hypothetical protein [Aquabacterium sp.]
MGAQLKPTAMNILASAPNSNSAILNDLVSRMNAQTGGAMQEEQKVAFSKWLERHASTTASADAPNQAARAMPARVKTPAEREPAPKPEAKAAEHQAQRADSKSAAKPAERQPDQKVANKNNNASKTANSGKAKEADKADDSAKVDDDKSVDHDEVKFSTQMGEGSAVVRELKAPADVNNDPTSMMAWLSGLAQSDAKLAQAQADAKEAGLGKSEGRGGKNSGVAALNALLAGQGV